MRAKGLSMAVGRKLQSAPQSKSAAFQPSCILRAPVIPQNAVTRLSTSVTSTRHQNSLLPIVNSRGYATERSIKLSNSSGSDALAALHKPEKDAPPAMGQLRVVPVSSSYFTSSPRFTDRLLELEHLDRKYAILPRIPPSAVPRTAWKSLRLIRAELSEPRIRAALFARTRPLLVSLNRIHPDLMPDEVKKALTLYRRDIDPNLVVRKPQLVDPYGRSQGVGRRKTSTAIAWLVEGSGQVVINGKSLTETFGRIHDRDSAIWALKATERLGRYNMWALVKGGGLTGQAEALTLAVAKSLLVHEPALKPALRKAGCIARDPRKVERKKPGRLKARKKGAWVKR